MPKIAAPISEYFGLVSPVRAAGTQPSHRIRFSSPGLQQNTRLAEGRTPVWRLPKCCGLSLWRPGIPEKSPSDFNIIIIHNCLEELRQEILVPNKKKCQYSKWERIGRNYLKADKNCSKKHSFEVQKLQPNMKWYSPYGHIWRSASRSIWEPAFQ